MCVCLISVCARVPMTQYEFVFVQKYITVPSMSCFVPVVLCSWMCEVCTLCWELGRSSPGVTDTLRPTVAGGENVCSQSETVILGLNKYCKHTYPAAQCDRALNRRNNIHQKGWGYLLWSLQILYKNWIQHRPVSIKSVWYYLWQDNMEKCRWKIEYNAV